MRCISWALCFLVLVGCESPVVEQAVATPVDTVLQAISVPLDTLPPPPRPLTQVELDSIFKLSDTTWVDLELLDPSLRTDIRYATTNNFMELQVYDCPRCLSRLATAKALLNVQRDVVQDGYSILLYDCYRPQRAQLKLWKKVPDRRYVAPPSRGSVHSRGGALDLTLVRLTDGQPLAMGTPYDFFGREAWWSYQDHPEEVLKNRQYLRQVMEKHGFKTVTTEWWHYNYRRAWFPLSDHQWPCE